MTTKAIATRPRTGPAKDGSRRGGARPGSGRKPNPTTVVVNDFHRTARDLIGPRLPMLLEEVYALAMGVKMVDVDPKTGETTEYYTVPPDFRACEYLINRLLGKPREHQEVSGPGGHPIPVAIVAAIDRVYGPEAAASRAAGLED
jgi:hypothetical protein